MGDTASRILNIKKAELPLALLSAAYFFCILCGYYFLRPVRDAMGGAASAYLSTALPTSRDITLEGTLDPEAFWPHVDTIGSSRWPGTWGGPRREL